MATPPRSASPMLTSPRPDLYYVHMYNHVEDLGPDTEPEMDEMDWIGDRLSRLIQEGQKALGREIVVMSDAKEDEVDDGSDAWEEERDHPRVSGPSCPVTVLFGPTVGCTNHATFTPRHRTLRILSHLPAVHPRKCQFEPDLVPLSLGRSTHRGSLPRVHPVDERASVDSNAFGAIASSPKKDESAWQSAELRESMERARARYLQRRGQ